MNIKYEFADGTRTEVEVAEDIRTIIIDSRKAEHAADVRGQYHYGWSIDATKYEGVHFIDPDGSPEDIASRRSEKKELSEILITALNTLTETQRRRLFLLASGMTIAEIAREEGSSFNSVKESIEAARKKMKKELKKNSETPSI